MTRSPALASAALHEAVRATMIDASERAIMPRYRRLAPDDVTEKSADELVTIADRESEAILAAGLAKILPEAEIFGEEAAAANFASGRRLGEQLCWIIDPLDGTGNFVAGEGPFGILVALADRGVAVGGWIFNPQTGRFCAALSGEGTMIDGARIYSRPSGSAVPTAGISSLFSASERRSDILARIGPHFTTVAISRCAAEQYPRVIHGINDVTLFERTLAWDHAAGALCLSEAGGVVTRLDGTPYRVDDDRCGLIAAATPRLWEFAIQHVRD